MSKNSVLLQPSRRRELQANARVALSHYREGYQTMDVVEHTYTTLRAIGKDET
jgi:hypothetical protein